MDRDEIASVLQLAPEQVHIVPSAIGGGFGGKLDLSVQPLLAVAAWKLGRAGARWSTSGPSRCCRAPSGIRREMQRARGVRREGRLVAFDFAGDFNTGAYSSWGPTVANRVPIHASGPYRVPHVRALTRAVLTNDSVAGAFRGFGVPQSTLLGELLIDELAARCGHRRARVPPSQRPRAGDRTPTGQMLAASVGLRECLDALRPGVARRAGAAATPSTPRAERERLARCAAAPASPACGTASATP